MTSDELIERKVSELINLPAEHAIRSAIAFGYALAGLDIAEHDARKNAAPEDARAADQHA